MVFKMVFQMVFVPNIFAGKMNGKTQSNRNLHKYGMNWYRII